MSVSFDVYVKCNWIQISRLNEYALDVRPTGLFTECPLITARKINRFKKLLLILLSVP